MPHFRVPVLFGLWLALGGLLADAPASLAQDTIPNYAHAPDIQHLWRWARFPVRVFVATHDSVESQQAQVVLAGFDEWVQATGGFIHYTVVNDPALADISVRFSPGESLPGQPGVAGETATAAVRGLLRHANMTLAVGGATPAELQSVAAHEFGHALGIGGHSDNPDDLMYPTETRVYLPDGTPLPTPPHPVTARDLNTLRFCYPRLFTP